MKFSARTPGRKRHAALHFCVSFCVLCILMTFCTSCAASKMMSAPESFDAIANESSDFYDAYYDEGVSYDKSYDALSGSSAGSYTDEAAPEADDASVVDAGRKIIYSSWFEISTEAYDASVEALDALCTKYGAYYESSESFGTKSDYSNRYASYVIRVPQKNYAAFLSGTAEIGSVTSSGENNRDVSEQYYDSEARLESAKLREERLLAILEDAKTLDDVLSLERELSDVRYEIESYAGTLKKFDSLINYSTVTVNLREVRKLLPPDSERQTLGARMSASLHRGFDSLRTGAGNFLVAFSYTLPALLCILLPIVIVIVVLLVLVVRHRRKAAARRAESLNPPHNPEPPHDGKD